MDLNDPTDTDPQRDLLEALRRSERALAISVEKRRYGKEVTLVSGFSPETDLKELAKTLKHKLAVGGSAKEDHIELQGNQSQRVREALAGMGYETGT